MQDSHVIVNLEKLIFNLKYEYSSRSSGLYERVKDEMITTINPSNSYVFRQ
jgi:hypothetical protein